MKKMGPSFAINGEERPETSSQAAPLAASGFPKKTSQERGSGGVKRERPLSSYFRR